MSACMCVFICALVNIISDVLWMLRCERDSRNAGCVRNLVHSVIVHSHC